MSFKDNTMKSAATQELLETLGAILNFAPDFRLGQLIGVLTDRVDHPYTLNPMVDIEDEELLPAAKDFLEVMRKRHEEIVREQRAVA
jgi:hypothetical protein